MKKKNFAKYLKEIFLYTLGISILLFFIYPRNMSINDLHTINLIHDDEVHIVLSVSKPVFGGPSIYIDTETYGTTAYISTKISYSHDYLFADGIDYVKISFPQHIKTIILKDKSGSERIIYSAFENNKDHND